MKRYWTIVSLRRKFYLYFYIVAQKIPLIHFYEYILHENVCYVVNPKVASSSIRLAFLKINASQSEPASSINEQRYFASPRRLKKLAKNYFVFCILRDPEHRILSCWEQKVNRKDRTGFRLFNQYFLWYFPFIRYGQSVSKFVDVVGKIPDWLSEKHFMSQVRVLGCDQIDYSKVYTLNRIGDLSAEIGELIPGFTLDEVGNATSADRVEIDEVTRKVIRSRYKRDYELFNSLSGL